MPTFLTSAILNGGPKVYNPLRCLPIVITEPIQRSRRHLSMYSSVTVRGTCPMLGGVLMLACLLWLLRSRIARTVRQGFSSPEWDLTKCLAYLNFREFYSSTLRGHCLVGKDTTTYPLLSCCWSHFHCHLSHCKRHGWHS